MSDIDLKQILEGALFASREPMSIYQMKSFLRSKSTDRGMLREVLTSLADIINRAVSLIEVAGGFRFGRSLAPIANLTDENLADTLERHLDARYDRISATGHSR